MELRKDYILDRWVVISSARGKRPHQFKSGTQEKAKKDFFAPGNEKLTPPEIGRIEKDGKWVLRWFPNKFGAVEAEGELNVKTDNTFYTYASAYGYHEILVETPDDKQLAELSVERIKQVLQVYSLRIIELSKKEGIKYVNVFKNNGANAGTSIQHSHSQIIAYNIVPNTIRDKVEACSKFDSCPYCSIIESERESDRKCFENDSFVAFTPYASRFQYEILVLPKKHVKSITDLSDSELGELASIMKQILDKLNSINAPYNYYLQYAPSGEDLHFHIEVIPRLAKWAGFEYCSGTVINAVPPEDAAKFYRGEL